MATAPHGDPGTYLAAERTFLAWIRTGLALMGFGFVVARFGLFLREFLAHQGGHSVSITGFSLAVGVVLVLAGVFVNVAATLHHIRLTRQLNRGEYRTEGPSFLATSVAIFLALVGFAMAIDLIIVR
jgi:putative membrane protein